MKGNLTIHFNELFLDTLRAHGLAWSRTYYMSRGMSAFEFGVWLRSVRAI